jgi:hypothetical protein
VARIEVIDRFGDEIEFDLLERGVCLYDFFTGRRPWAQLERILARLPRHSHYKAAMDNDEDYARVALALSGSDEVRPGPVPLAGYSELAVRMDNIFDAVNALNETLIAVYSSKNRARPRPTRAPRPQTAFQRLRREQTVARLNDIVEKMTGGR